MLKSIERSLEKVPMKSLHSDEGQVAVILVLITAMALIFYAVILNLGSMTQTKTIITLAANQAVAMLASEMASYGNSLTQTHLRGRKKVCDSTNVLVLIIGLIITIIITVFFPPAGLALALVIFGILLTVGAIYIQLVYVQPMMTELWNKASQETMSTRDSFLEQAINTGLRTAITDSVQVPDVFDYDADGLWGFDGLTHKDEMSRYSFYYHNRYESVEQLDDDFLDEDFLPALQEFVYNESDGWGLYDPIDDTLCVPSSAADHACCYEKGFKDVVPSKCNPCCMPTRFQDIFGAPGDTISLVPECCDCDYPGGPCDGFPEDQCGTSTTCDTESPYYSAGGPEYKYVYDRFFENYENNPSYGGAGPFFQSLREKMGRDDEHHQFYRDHQFPNQRPQHLHLPVDERFRVQDATGFYNAPFNHVDEDYDSGIYSYFHKLNEWGWDLSLLAPTEYEHCYWYDPVFSVAPIPHCVALTSPPMPKELIDTDPTQPMGTPDGVLNLPLDPQELFYNVYAYVDGTNNNAADHRVPPLAADRIHMPAGIIAADNVCAQEAILHPVPLRGFWKPGGDIHCTAGDPVAGPEPWPYSAHCPKHLWDPVTMTSPCTEPDGEGGVLYLDCDCDSVGVGIDPTQWPDDVPDDIVYGITTFIAWAQELLRLWDAGINDLVSDFDIWYEDVARWIEPGVVESGAVPGIDCFICDDEDGGLIKWMKEFRGMKQRLQYLKESYSFAGTYCNEAWCVPPSEDPTNPGNRCPGIPNEIQNRIDFNGNGTEGDLEDVVECLRWSVEAQAPNYPITGPFPTGHGNADKFMTCAQTCSDILAYPPPAPGDPSIIMRNCSNLPRSLLSNEIAPFYDPQAYVDQTDPLDQGDLQLILDCYWDCWDGTQTACDLLPGTQASTGMDYHYTVDGLWPPPMGGYGDGICAGWDYDAPGLFFKDVVLAGIMAGGGWPNPYCDLRPPRDPNWPNAPIWGGWLYLTMESGREAQNQVAKFEHRLEFLQNRIDEIDKMITLFEEAETKFNEFLDGPARNLIIERINWVTDVRESGLPYHAIYAWKDEPEPGEIESDWHIVRVDARMLGKCHNECGIDPAGSPDPGMPRIITEEKGWTKRCYELINERGMVKVRVTRFDEAKYKTMFRFPNNIPIWLFRFFHPERGIQSRKDAPDLIEFTCMDQMIVDPPTLPPTYVNIYQGAFMLNKYEPGAVGGNQTCWDLMTYLLAFGATQETCAKYYWHNSPKRGVGMQFMHCPDFK